MASKKPLKGFTGHWIDISWEVLSDQSFYVDVPAKRKAAKKRGAMEPTTGMRRAYARQMGLATIRRKMASAFTAEPQFVLYVHSQVTDSPWHQQGPAETIFIDREDMEKLIPMALRALMDA